MDRVAPRAAPAGEIRPADVLGIVLAAQEQINQVKREYGIQVSADPDEIERGRQPKDVFVAILQASRQLNLMVQRKFRPEDVYERLLLGSTYVAGALSMNAERPVYASATHGSSKFAMATGQVGDDTEGIFMLDYLTGDLQCLVIYPRTGTFRARFVANVVRDLAA